MHRWARMSGLLVVAAVAAGCGEAPPPNDHSPEPMVEDARSLERGKPQFGLAGGVWATARFVPESADHWFLRVEATVDDANVRANMGVHTALNRYVPHAAERFDGMERVIVVTRKSPWETVRFALEHRGHNPATGKDEYSGGIWVTDAQRELIEPRVGTGLDLHLETNVADFELFTIHTPNHHTPG